MKKSYLQWFECPSDVVAMAFEYADIGVLLHQGRVRVHYNYFAVFDVFFLDIEDSDVEGEEVWHEYVFSAPSKQHLLDVLYVLLDYGGSELELFYDTVREWRLP